MAVAGGTQGGGGGSSVGASSGSSSSGDGGGGGGGSASVPGCRVQPLLLPLAAPLSSPPTPLPPPARPPLPSTTSVLRGAHISGGRSGRWHTGGGSRFLPSGRAESGGWRRGGSPEGGSGPRSVRWAGCVAAGRGGDFLFSSAAADDADADAAVRETEPSMGPQPLKRVH